MGGWEARVGQTLSEITRSKSIFLYFGIEKDLHTTCCSLILFVLPLKGKFMEFNNSYNY